jgi:acetyl esterase/lipase
MKTILLILKLVPAFILVTLAGCSPLGVLNSLVPSDSHKLTSDVAYGSALRHKLDVYSPTSAAPAGGYPVVVFFYGGSWNRGDKADYKFVGEALASRGILAMVADYRLYPEVRYPDFLSDCALALAYGLDKAANFNGNPKRVFVMGHSAGAYNASMLALDERWLKAVGRSTTELAGFIGLAGPYDFLPMTNTATQPVFFHPNYPAGSQTIDYFSANSLRTFLGAATEDSLVNSQRNTVGLHNRLKVAGATTTLKLYDRVNHMTLVAALGAPVRWLAPVLDDVVEFVNAPK